MAGDTLVSRLSTDGRDEGLERGIYVVGWGRDVKRYNRRRRARIGKRLPRHAMELETHAFDTETGCCLCPESQTSNESPGSDEMEILAS